ncbi:GlxA family transcriptional regulator [Vibrio hangzhouensis]|uniref:Transcriptional regulator GlxA family, contains an amidase domain and an AraC-type DNA-binding HTH domain n=1 Tax=Vibrio hangzhouensis TaxID=462991 RepID=A0A1H5RPB7_9VIBR|nr:helix-turn-helix domain-containing protein [Vibrio hangzhouensis]SEF40120.1 Transcriptional regulator GlxA family, contains an amidase domain and an AraC-type DNA-binding HTH domain [Vibrio hangzhouensis]
MTNCAPKPPRTHNVAIVLFNKVVLADALLAYETFSRARLPSGEAPYHVYFCATDDIEQKNGLLINVLYSLEHLANADTIIIPGVSDLTSPVSEQLSSSLHKHVEKSGRLLSICTGAFVLASSGLLDGLEVTTHWLHAMQLKQMYPRLNVNPDVLYVDNGQILTSAGAIAGVDLCLYVVSLDLGSNIANELAKVSVVQMHRDGGQKQFINKNHSTTEKSQIYNLICRIEENLADNYSIEQMAERVYMTPRTFSRKFKHELGLTPFEWLNYARIKHAKQLLESTELTIEQISYASGLGSPKNMRKQFQKSVGVSPRDYRKAFHHAN